MMGSFDAARRAHQHTLTGSPALVDDLGVSGVNELSGF